MHTTFALSIGWLLALGACGASSARGPGSAPEPSAGGRSGDGSAGSNDSAVPGNGTGSGGNLGSAGNRGTTNGADAGIATTGGGGSIEPTDRADAGGDRSNGDGVDSDDAGNPDSAGPGGPSRADAGGGALMRADASTDRMTDAGADASAPPRSDGGATTPGLGPWTTGYVATMFGNNMSGDCAGYPNFSDMTAIRTSTCSRVVSVASYIPGVANNASFYGATGDVSSLWTGAACACNGSDTCTGTQTPSCPAEQQAGGNCGICVAVRCDPAGTFALSGSTHNQECNATSFAVVQILDACPHNHPTNLASIAGWCTSRQANHIDLSCSALGGISTIGMNIGRDGWLNVAVQRVNCGIGLGLHPL